jgi:GGDEF domain-containing protein
VGEAVFPDDGSDTEQLLAEADRRMYQAKEIGKRTCHLGLATLEMPVPAGMIQ